MIDLGVSKLALIAVVALVVVGPERLPKIARMAGNLFSRAQLYMSEVRSEVNGSFVPAAQLRVAKATAGSHWL